MINLLPSEQKERLGMEKINKLVIIHWILIFFFLMCFISVLFAVRVYFKAQATAQESAVITEKSASDIQEVASFKETAKVLNQKIGEQIDFFKNKIYFSDILEKISSQLPPNVRLTNISVNLSEKDEIIKCSIAGFALIREDLVALNENLGKESSFFDLSFPASNWVKAENISFTVSFNIKK